MMTRQTRENDLPQHPLWSSSWEDRMDYLVTKAIYYMLHFRSVSQNSKSGENSLIGAIRELHVEGIRSGQAGVG